MSYQRRMLFKVVCLCLLQAAAVFSALPAGWSPCKKGAGDQNACLQKAITEAIKTLLEGNKDLDLPPFDPVVAGEIKTVAEGHKLASLDSTFDNFTFFNYKSLTITKVELDGKKLKIDYSIPDGPEAKSGYKMKGRVVSVPLFGEGDSHFKFVNTKVSAVLTFKDKPETRDGKNYYVVDKFEATRSVDKIEVGLSHLENDELELENAMIKHLNNNWDVLWEDLRFPFEEALNKHHLDYANKVFSKIPADDLGFM